MSKYTTVKRILDIFVSTLLILCTAVFWLVLPIIILLDDGRPVIFSHLRIGKDARPFRIYKFRTLKTDVSSSVPTSELSDTDCYTRAGKWIRRISLDELPQLFNVLKGDMSMVGPRPLIPEEESVHQLRLENGVYSVRPGITGLAQINGKNALSDEVKVGYDREYIRTISFATDVRIVFSTVPQMLAGDRIRKKQKDSLSDGAE